MITVGWDDDAKTIIMWQFSEQWTADNFAQAVTANRALLDSQDHDVDVIVDLRQTSHMPSNILSLAANALRLGSPKVRLVAVISQHSLWTKMLSAFNQIHTSRFTRIQLVGDLAEAYDLIQVRQ